jgi:hypothetical protein
MGSTGSNPVLTTNRNNMYKIFRDNNIWLVYSGREHPNGYWVKDIVVFTNESITECYYWIKAKKEGFIYM